jgi:hypothetical protein
MKIEQEQEILNLKALIEDRQKEVFKKYQRILKYSELYNKNVEPSENGELIHG